MKKREEDKELVMAYLAMKDAIRDEELDYQERMSDYLLGETADFNSHERGFMPNSEYNYLGRGKKKGQTKYDPVIEFRNLVVEMRKKQTTFNQKGTKKNLYDAVLAENEVDEIIFGPKGILFDDKGDRRVKQVDSKSPDGRQFQT